MSREVVRRVEWDGWGNEGLRGQKQGGGRAEKGCDEQDQQSLRRVHHDAENIAEEEHMQQRTTAAA
jgi:hypothetical protein